MARLSAARNARNALILTGVGHFSARFFELMLPTLAVALASQTRMPLDVVLDWTFLAYLLFGLGALPAALVAERFSPRLLLITALFGLGVAALAASEAPNGRVLSLCLAAMGSCASIFHPAGASLSARTIDTQDRAPRGNGVFGNVAVALTPLITATLCAQLGWQSAVRAIGYALCVGAVACGFLRVIERRPVPTGEPDSSAPRGGASLPLAVLVAAAALAAVSYRGGTLLLPSSFAGRVPVIGFGAAISLAYGFGVAGEYATRWLAYRYDPRRLYLAFHAISVPALLLMATLSGLPLIGGAALFAFCSFGMQPIENGLLAQYAPPRWGEVAWRATLALTVGVGSLAVWLVGWAIAAGGLSYALLWLAGITALATAAAAWLVYLHEPAVLHGLSGGRRAAGAGGGGVVFDAGGAAERRPPGQASIP